MAAAGTAMPTAVAVAVAVVVVIVIFVDDARDDPPLAPGDAIVVVVAVAVTAIVDDARRAVARREEEWERPLLFPYARRRRFRARRPHR